MSSSTGGVWELIMEHCGLGGMVDMRKFQRGLYNLTIEGEHIDGIIRQLRQSGAIWFWGSQMIVPKPWNCFHCRRRVEKRVSLHMDACLNEQRRLPERRAGFRD